MRGEGANRNPLGRGDRIEIVGEAFADGLLEREPWRVHVDELADRADADDALLGEQSDVRSSDGRQEMMRARRDDGDVAHDDERRLARVHRVLLDERSPVDRVAGTELVEERIRDTSASPHEVGLRRGVSPDGAQEGVDRVRGGGSVHLPGPDLSSASPDDEAAFRPKPSSIG